MKLTKLRTVQGLILQDIGEKIDVATTTVSQYERNFDKGKPGSINKLKRHLKGLGLELKIMVIVPDGHYHFEAGKEIELSLTKESK